MKLTSALFEAYLKCPTKCYLRSTGQAESGNAYAEWVREQKDAYRNEGAQRLMSATEGEAVVVTPGTENLKTATWRLAVDLSLETETMASRLHAVERVPSQGRGRPAQFIPVRFNFFNKFTKDDRLLVAFDALVLSEVLGREVSVGNIIHGDDHAPLKVKVTSLLATVRKLTAKVSAMLSAGSPPDVILNRHCGQCEFRAGCRQKAVEKDDLSLLLGMSEKERKKCHEQGIFTVTQLSYTFRARRRPKRLRDKREKYHHALKALAIREKKIHIIGDPELKIEGTPVYLDVEGLPDRDFYYLIGLRVGNGDFAVQHSLWADTVQDEGKIWREFLSVLEGIEKPVLIHYGSYETNFFRVMVERYGGPPEGSVTAETVRSSLNLLSTIFAQVYFPTFSNGLKDVGGWLGCQWNDSTASGLQSIVWRMAWQTTSSPGSKQRLLLYNSEDCHALAALTKAIIRMCNPDGRIVTGHEPQTTPVMVEDSASKDTLWPPFSSGVQAFEAINKAARWDFQRDRIYLRTDSVIRRASKARDAAARRSTRINKETEYQRDSTCPLCGKKLEFRHWVKKRIYDIRFSRFGLRRWVVLYRYKASWCRPCHHCVGTPSEFKPWGIYGRNLVMFAMYQLIELCMPQRAVKQGLNRLFGFGFQEGEVHRLKATTSKYFADTRNGILQSLLKGSLIHADETPITVNRRRAYVWVFTSFREVVYFYTDTREGGFVQETLKEFKGVLVSDFYAPYDALSCSQQKCLLHLVRDLNDTLQDCPYDEELKQIINSFAELLKSTVETIDKWGLKHRFLRKHLIDVDRFYRKMTKTSYTSEAASKWKDRFMRSKNSLFTFLEHDGVPWNNNNAEHAIKAFARLRRVIEGLSTSKGIDDYLVLLSICQTCKYQGLDFLDFLRSGEKDVHAFAESRLGRRRRQQTNQPEPPPAEEGNQK
jgi:predicted RecB family nuclease